MNDDFDNSRDDKAMLEKLAARPGDRAPGDISIPDVVAELTDRYGPPRVKPASTRGVACPLTTGELEGQWAWRLAWAWFPGSVNHYFSIEVTTDGKHWLIRAGHHQIPPAQPGFSFKSAQDSYESFSRRPSEDMIRSVCVAAGLLAA